MTLLLIAGYALVMIFIAVTFRHHRSGDDFLMADRSTNPLLVAAGLFTLIGGGELVTLTALAFLYGSAGLSLFIGYALAFLFLAYIAPQLRRGEGASSFLSLPDYAHYYFGKTAGWLVFALSFTAFFSMLLLQFTAGGQILAPLAGITYQSAVFAVAAIAFLYLQIGGLRTVFATDAVQGGAMLCLMPVVLIALRDSTAQSFRTSTEPFPLLFFVSLVLTGFFVGASSADVWQRVYAARTARAARVGLCLGAGFLLLFGGLLVALGVRARSLPDITSPDTAFVEVMTGSLPGPLLALVVVLVFSAIMSTADTEIFLLSGMTVRQILRARGVSERGLRDAESIRLSRILIAVISVGAVTLAIFAGSLVTIYTWLLSAIIVMAPAIIFSSFTRLRPWLFTGSIVVNLTALGVGVTSGLITLDNLYWLVVPGAVLIGAGLFYPRPSLNKVERPRQ